MGVEVWAYRDTFLPHHYLLTLVIFVFNIMRPTRFILLPVLLLLCFSTRSYCQIPEVMVGDTEVVAIFNQPAGGMYQACEDWEFSLSRHINNRFSYHTINLNHRYQLGQGDTLNALFSPTTLGLQSDSAFFHSFWHCEPPGHLFEYSEFFHFEFNAKGIDSVVAIKIKDPTVIFPIDTQTRRYEPKTELFYFYNNIADSALFDSWQLVIDPSAKISFTVDSNSSALTEYRSMPFTRKKQLNFTFSTSLPADSARTYPAIMRTRVRHNGLDSNYSNNFTVVLPAAPKSEVYRNIAEDIIFKINPNPASGQTMLRLTSSSLEPVTIEIYDILGKRASIVAENLYCQGIREFPFNTQTLPKGEYFVRLTFGKRIITRKVIIK